jgi:hypothetical protein
VRTCSSAALAYRLQSRQQPSGGSGMDSIQRQYSAFALSAATACLLPTCFARSARAPFWLPNFTPRALAATRAALVRALIMRDAAQRGQRREAIRLEGTGRL